MPVKHTIAARVSTRYQLWVLLIPKLYPMLNKPDLESLFMLNHSFKVPLEMLGNFKYFIKGNLV